MHLLLLLLKVKTWCYLIQLMQNIVQQSRYLVKHFFMNMLLRLGFEYCLFVVLQFRDALLYIF